MTISTTTNRVQFDGDDTTTIFAYAFRIYAAGDLVVITTTSGVDTTQTLNTDYSVSINASTASPGGNVTMTSAPATGTTLTIYRDLAATQSTAYTVGGPFPAASHELALDRLTLLVQDLSERIDRRTPDYGVTSSGTGPY